MDFIDLAIVRIVQSTCQKLVKYSLYVFSCPVFQWMLSINAYFVGNFFEHEGKHESCHEAYIEIDNSKVISITQLSDDVEIMIESDIYKTSNCELSKGMKVLVM